MGKIIMNTKTLILLAILLVGTQALAVSVTVPNTFVDGTTASASEVNANFDVMASALNNIRSINVYVNGVRRGALIDSHSGANPPSFLTAVGFRVLLDSGYIALVSTAGDGLRKLWLGYESTNCTGQPYKYMNDWNPILARQGMVYSNDTPALDTLYYVQAGTVTETITIESSMRDGVCTLRSEPNVNAAKVFVNEPTITGVTKNDFIGDVTVGF